MKNMMVTTKLRNKCIALLNPSNTLLNSDTRSGSSLLHRSVEVLLTTVFTKKPFFDKLNTPGCLLHRRDGTHGVPNFQQCDYEGYVFKGAVDGANHGEHQAGFVH